MMIRGAFRLGGLSIVTSSSVRERVEMAGEQLVLDFIFFLYSFGRKQSGGGDDFGGYRGC
jgi:hypothetical protein